MNERVAALAYTLAEAGVGALFGIPGSGLSWQLITALDRYGVRFIGARHEGAGAIMAGAYARQTGTLGCAVTIKGPGLANSIPGIVSNQYEQWPVMTIAEAFGPATPSYRMHKRLDHATLLRPVTKAYSSLGGGAFTVPELAEIAKAEVPGSVHLDLILESGASANDPAALLSSRVEGSSGLVDRIRRSDRPVVIAGSLATRRDWGARLDSLRIPVFTTTAAKGVVDEHGPSAAGVFTGDGKALAPESVVIPQADLIVGLGLRNLEVLVPKRFSAPLLLVDAAGVAVGEGFAAEAASLTAPDQTFDEILDALAEKQWGLDVVNHAVSNARERLLSHDWLPGRVLERLNSVTPDSCRLIVDTGSFCTVAEHVWRARRWTGFVASANGRYMGTGIPMALGSAIANPHDVHVCAVGDGGMMYASELKLAVERKLPLLMVLMRDGRYGSIVAGASAPGLDMRAVTIGEPSWWRAAEALGFAATPVRSLSEMEKAVEGWRAAEGPAFIEAIFDPEPYAVMTAEIR